jgi:hypothetical protein
MRWLSRRCGDARRRDNVVVYELVSALTASLEHLRNRGENLAKLVGIIEGMLKFGPKERTTAKDLVEQLEAI